jgi:uncharacterized protein YndB with AHSA1/START domain
MDRNATVDRASDRELVVTRTIDGPARLVYQAWTTPELMRQWWTPESFPISLLTCEMDVRVGGGYRLTFGYEDSTFEFYGRYLEVTPPSRLVWTNDEGEGETITTVTFEEVDGRTSLRIHDLYPSKDALDAAIASGSTSGMPESLEQLDRLVATLGASDGA